MKNEHYSSDQHKNKSKRTQELEWIDLDNTGRKKSGTVSGAPKNTGAKKRPPEKHGISFHFHIVLLALILIVFASIAFKLLFWDKRIREDNEIESDTSLNFDTEPLDSIVPLDSSGSEHFERDDELTILFLGNGFLAQDKDSETNMANIIAKETGATVYNCSIPGSYLSMYNSSYSQEYPYDAFSFYNMCTIFTVDNTKTISWADYHLNGLPDEVKEPLDLLQTIDPSKLDILCVCYDASDYLEQRNIYDEMNATNPSTFQGALSAGVQLVQEMLPQVRIIVMSPTYTYVVDDDGNYTSPLSGDILKMSLVDYINYEYLACMESHVTFVDNFYGTIHEKNADQYLEDNIHPTPEGNALLADRFLYALNRFHNYGLPASE